MLVPVDCVMYVFGVFEVMPDHDCRLEIESLCVAVAVQLLARREERDRSSTLRIKPRIVIIAIL
jgi:ArsR family metal-binding transcriptional regulator